MKKPLLALLAIAAPVEARAENIVLSNDDGLTSNVKALYEELKAQGHDVIVSVPCSGQSGMGAAIRFMRPLGPLAADCLNGAAKAGEPGAGPMTRPGFGKDWYYVDGTPVMALLYGLDVVAQARWGKAPDLVLSGPNEGQNVGSIVISSGTVSVAQYGAIRGIPSIALSGGMNTADNKDLANPASVTIAKLSADFISALKKGASGKPILPVGVSLNVNFPDKLDGAKWRRARIGSYSAYGVRFVSSFGKSGLPGIALDLITSNPEKAQRGDESAIVARDISVSVMQVGYDAQPAAQKLLSKSLRGIVKD